MSANVRGYIYVCVGVDIDVRVRVSVCVGSSIHLFVYWFEV